MSLKRRRPFSDDLLVPERGWLSGFVPSGRGLRPNPRGEYTLIVPLAPLVLPEGHPLAGEREEASLQFPGVPLPAERVRDLEGATLAAGDEGRPVIGELHIAGSYVPLELRRLRLRVIADGAIEATMKVLLDFQDELGGADSGFLTREAVISTALELDTEPALLPAFQLLEGRYRPTTESIMFVEVPAERFAHWLVEWMRTRRGPRHPTRVERLTGTLADALERLAPLRAARSRRLIVPTRSSWSAYLDNVYRGSDPSSLSYYAEALSCRAVRVVCGPDATMFELYGAEDSQPTRHLARNLIRAVKVENDAGWTFDLDGEPQPFERPERYAERRIRDRFTPEMLRDYLAAIGIRAFEERFYMPEGEAWLVEQDIPLHPGERAWSFAEVQAGLPDAPDA